jgi:hypothetical protein
MCVVNVGLGQCPATPASCIDNKRYVWTCGPETNYVQQSELSSDTTLCSETNPGGPQVSVFKFEPNIVATDADSCQITIEASNVTSCRLYNREIEDTALSASLNALIVPVANTLNTSGSINVPVGTYELGCSGPLSQTETISTLFGSQKCSVNPNYKEI